MVSRSKQICFILLCLLSTNLLAGEKPVKINPDHILKDRDEVAFYAFTFLPKTPGIFTDNSNKKRKLKLPESTGQAGFANSNCFVYEFLRNNLSPLYFTNIGARNMCVYLDRNHNFNYTDDGPPFEADEQGGVSVQIRSPFFKDVSITCYYQLISNLKREDSMIYNYPSLVTQNEQLLAPQYWLKVKADAIKGKNLVIGKDSMCVALIDKDLSGFYGQGQDEIALIPYGSDSANSRLGKGPHLLQDGMILSFKGKAYEVQLDDPDIVSLLYRPDIQALPEVFIGQKLPDFQVTLLDGSTTNIYSLMVPGKATYINFWSIGLYNYTPKMRDSIKVLFETNHDSLTMISFCTDPDKVAAKKYISDNQMNWPQCLSDEALETLLFHVGETVEGVLIDKDGKVLYLNMIPIFVMKGLAHSDSK